MPDNREPQLHEHLRVLLNSAEAESCHVAAIFLDVRGFSSYASKGESFDIAFYLRRVFKRILDDYFPNASFFKPTGDGLLIVHELPSDPETLPTTLSALLTSCVTLVGAFSHLASDDIMVTGQTPEKLGIGLARGTATGLVSNGAVVDYTGRCLNLAARLMDKARPSGVVFHDDHAAQLMDAQLALLFSTDGVCIRGISEQKPIPIYITESVIISPADRESAPDSKYTYGHRTTLTVEEVKQMDSFGFHLPRAPRSYEVAGVFVEYPGFDATGKETHTIRTISIENGRMEEHPESFVYYISLRTSAPSAHHFFFPGPTAATDEASRTAVTAFLLGREATSPRRATKP